MSRVLIIIACILLILNFGAGISEECLKDPCFSKRLGSSTSEAPDTAFFLWKSEISTMNLVTSPLVGSERIVQPAYNLLVCLDTNGQEMWRFEERFGCVALAENKVVVGRGADLYCLDLEDGSILWEAETAIASGSPTVTEDSICLASITPDRIFIDPLWARISQYLKELLHGCEECEISCHDLQTGEQTWTYHEDKDIRSVSYIQGRFIVLLKKGEIYSLDMETKEKLWHFASEEKAHGHPSIDKHQIAFVDNSFVYCLDSETGYLFWKFPVVEGSSPEIAYGLVFVHSSDGFLYCIDEFTGELAWKASTWLDTPQELWANFQSSPVSADGKVFVGSTDKNIYCFDAETGTLLWKYSLGGAIVVSPAVIGGNLYVPCVDGNLYAFGIDPETDFQKAQGYMGERDFENAEKYCTKAREWYLHKGDLDEVAICDEFMEILKGKIQEYSVIEESDKQAQEYFDQGNEALLWKRFDDALEFYDLSRTSYEGMHDEPGIEKCNQRINYIKGKTQSQNSAIFFFYAIIPVALACIIVILLSMKRNG